MPEKPILTKEERAVIKSMSLYWDEVMQRKDQSPLAHEVERIYRMLNADRLLLIVKRYAESEGW